MRQTITTYKQAPPSTVVIQQAYEVFFSQQKRDVTTDYPGDDAIGVLLPEEGVAISDPDVEAWIKFQELFSRWRIERGAMSSITEAVLRPAYQAIIGMGPTAVPFMLAELESNQDEPDQWFWALKAITGADPVAEEDRGDFVAMAKAWLQWAHQSEYAW